MHHFTPPGADLPSENGFVMSQPCGDAGPVAPAAPEAQPSAAFTPGPWCWIFDDDAYQTLNAPHPDGGGFYVLTAEYDSADHKAVSTWIDVSVANARLIAAAPDLLRQLEFAVAILEEARIRVGYADGSLGQIEIDEAIDDGYAAIAKALGSAGQ